MFLRDVTLLSARAESVHQCIALLANGVLASVGSERDIPN